MDINYEFIGWSRDEAKNSDKVWTCIFLGQVGTDRIKRKYVAAYGRRGKKLQTKIYEMDQWKMNDLIRSKTKKGYKGIEPDQLDKVYPDFEKDLKKTAFWVMMTT